MNDQTTNSTTPSTTGDRTPQSAAATVDTFRGSYTGTSSEAPTSNLAARTRAGTVTMTETAESQDTEPEVLELTLRSRPQVRW